MTRPRIRVLVCGEPLRGDDGAAVVAAAGLTPEARALAEVFEVGQLSLSTMLDIPAGTDVIVADAAVGVAPGEVVIVSLADVAAHAGAAPASSHSLPPDQILALAGEMRGTPFEGVFVGIGATEFGFGEDLSPAVAAGVPALTAALEAEIWRLAAD